MKNTKYFKNEDLKAKETQEIKTKGEKFPEDLFCKKIKKKIKKIFFLNRYETNYWKCMWNNWNYS